ncbi:MAG: hypothetical protein ACJ788_27635, partial [Ktedonobacteraceae bacterium]
PPLPYIKKLFQPATLSSMRSFISTPDIFVRWQQGCHPTSHLWQEVQACGFCGSWMMVSRWVQLQGDGKTQALAQPQRQVTAAAPTMAPRHLAWLFLRDPEQLEKQEKQTLALIGKAQKVEIASGLAHQFVPLLKERTAQPLETWLWDCQKRGWGKR